MYISKYRYVRCTVVKCSVSCIHNVCFFYFKFSKSSTYTIIVASMIRKFTWKILLSKVDIFCNIPIFYKFCVRARYGRVLGSAVNPVLREGNSDRRCAPPVKEQVYEQRVIIPREDQRLVVFP